MRTILILCLALAACGDDDQAAPDTAGDVAGAWRSAGLNVTGFAATDGRALGGGECARGKVDDIEVTLCRYNTEDAAKAAQPAGLELVGQTTGSALASGKFLLVVSDRDKTDPEGKRINQIIQTYRGRTALVPPDRATMSKPSAQGG
jgi:hypothetical protein